MTTALRGLALALVAVSLGLAATGCAGPTAAERFKGNPLFDPDFVPIAVGGQNLTNARIYHDAGINLYVSIDDIAEKPANDKERPPTAETLKILSDLGMYAVADQKVWGKLRDNRTIVAWICPVDEPDNRQDETGQAMPLEKFLAESRRLKAADPTRPYIVCFGQGVINDGFGGRAIDRSEYPRYMEPVDFIHYDFYPIANFKWGKNLPRPTDGTAEIWRSDGEWHLDMVGQGVDRIRRWTGGTKPVMCWIETSHNHNPNRISAPAQTNCEVWDSMVHGARGVAYFSHDFTLPREAGQAAALSRNTEKLAQLKITNGKLQKLARVISAPLASEPAEATSNGVGKVIFSTKKVDGDTVVLSVNVFGIPTTANLYVVGLKKGAQVEVLEENRTLQAAGDGFFTDAFGPYQEHIYQIRN